MLKLVNLTKIYKSSENVGIGIQNVNLELKRGEFVAIVGPSGAGKTTLLNVISGMDSYEEGEFYIDGKSTSDFSIDDFENYRRANVAFIFQNYQHYKKAIKTALSFYSLLYLLNVIFKTKENQEVAWQMGVKKNLI